MIGRVRDRAVVAVVKPGLPAEVIRVLAGVLPVLVAVDSVCAMACSRAGEMPTVQLLSDDCA